MIKLFISKYNLIFGQAEAHHMSQPVHKVDLPAQMLEGKSSIMRNMFSLTQGNIVYVLVGQIGSTNAIANAGGGGGSFVVLNNAPLIVAGAGYSSNGYGGGGFSGGGGNSLNGIAYVNGGLGGLATGNSIGAFGGFGSGACGYANGTTFNVAGGGGGGGYSGGSGGTYGGGGSYGDSYIGMNTGNGYVTIQQV